MLHTGRKVTYMPDAKKAKIKVFANGTVSIPKKYKKDKQKIMVKAAGKGTYNAGQTAFIITKSVEIKKIGVSFDSASV